MNLSAIAEFGADWIEVGRAQLVALVGDRDLAVGGLAAIEETEVVAAGELVELDDYYTDQAAVRRCGGRCVGWSPSCCCGSAVVASAAAESGEDRSESVEVACGVRGRGVGCCGDPWSWSRPLRSPWSWSRPLRSPWSWSRPPRSPWSWTSLRLSVSPTARSRVVATGSVASESAAAEESDDQAVVGAIAAAEVVAAAAEIVELARIEEMAAVESLVGAEEDVLTEEEERAVAEVSEIVVAVEAAAEEAVVGVAAVGGTAIAATDAELDEFDEVVAAEGVVFESVVLESESAAGAFGEGSVAAGLIAEGASVEAEAAEAEAIAVAQAEAAEAEEAEEAAAVVAAGIVAGLVAAEAAEAAAAAAVAVPPEEIAVGVAAVPPEAVVVGMASVPPEQVAVGVAAGAPVPSPASMGHRDRRDPADHPVRGRHPGLDRALSGIAGQPADPDRGADRDADAGRRRPAGHRHADAITLGHLQRRCSGDVPVSVVDANRAVRESVQHRRDVDIDHQAEQVQASEAVSEHQQAAGDRRQDHRSVRRRGGADPAGWRVVDLGRRRRG